MSRLGERVPLLAVLDPADVGTGTTDSNWADLSKNFQVSAILLFGNLDIVNTINASLIQATDDSGSGAKSITGKSITELTEVPGGYHDNTQVVLSVNANELDVNNGFTHVAIRVVASGGSTMFASAVIIGAVTRFQPVDDHDVSTVSEIVN